MVQKININLIPAEYRVYQKRFVIKREIFYPAIFSVLLVLAMFAWSSMLLRQTESVTKNIARIEMEIEANKPVQSEIKQLQDRQALMRTKVVGLKTIDVDRSRWVQFLQLFAKDLPKNSWIEKIEEKENSVTITGVTEAFAEVGQFMARLTDSPMNVAGIELLHVKDKGKNGELLEFVIKQTNGVVSAGAQ